MFLQEMILQNDDLVSLAWRQFLQVTVLIATVRIVVRVVCHRRPHLAYLLWMLVVVKCLTPPFWNSRTGMFSWAQVQRTSSHVAVDVLDTVGRESLDATNVFAHPDSGDRRPRLIRSDTTTGQLQAAVVPSEKEWSGVTIAVGVWLGGVVVLGTAAWINWFGSLRLSLSSEPVTDEAIGSLMRQLRRRLRVWRKVRLLVNPKSTGPVAFGIVCPTVVIPKALMLGKSRKQIEPILAHELIHVRRGDALLATLQTLAQVLWWFHPLVWWANREACRQRERCCDEEVLAELGYEPAEYAGCLIDVLEEKRRLIPVLVSQGVRAFEVTSKRLEQIMAHRGPFESRTPRWCWGLLLIAGFVVLPGAALVVGSNSTVSAEVPGEAASGQQPDHQDQVEDPAEAATSPGTLKVLGCLIKISKAVNVPAQAHGVVKSLATKVGMRIEKGELLASIDDSDEQIRKRVAKLALDAATHQANNDVNMRFANKSAEFAKADYEEAVNANKKMAGTIAAGKVRKLDLNLQRSVLALEQAEFDRKLAHIAAASKVAEAKAASLLVDRHRIQAPISGDVVEVYCRQGEWVNTGDPICRIVQMDHLLVECFVSSEDHDPEELAGRNVIVKVRRARGRTEQFDGNITHVGPLVETGGKYLLQATVKNRSTKGHWILRPGLLAEMMIKTQVGDGKP